MTEVTAMTAAHTQRLSELEAACFSQPRSRSQLEEELQNPAAVFLTALCGGEVAGYCGMHTVLDEGYVDDVAVFAQYRQQGVGAALMTELERRGRERGLSFISLEVRASNQAAIRLYEKLGYAAAGRRRNFYSLPAEDAILYTKSLK